MQTGVVTFHQIELLFHLAVQAHKCYLRVPMGVASLETECTHVPSFSQRYLLLLANVCSAVYNIKSNVIQLPVTSSTASSGHKHFWISVSSFVIG